MRSGDRYGAGWVVVAVAMALAAGLLLSGCGTTTSQARKVEPSGFLGDYSLFKPGAGDDALLVYVNHQTDIKNYDKIMLDPVRVYAAQDSSLGKLSQEELQNLVNYLDATLRERLKTDYALVTAPGPGVMRLRVAITEARGSKVLLDTFSSVMPPAVALSALKTGITGAGTAVGSAGAECEALDSVSGARLFGAVDARVGRKYTGKFDKFDKWHAVTDAFDYWAERLQTRLREAGNNH